jgi:hypothetical protein
MWNERCPKCLAQRCTTCKGAGKVWGMWGDCTACKGRKGIPCSSHR